MNATLADLHEAAVFEFLPFVGAVLNGRPGAPPKTPLPPADPNALPLQVVEALQAALPRGVLASLVRAGGWKRTPIAGPHDERATPLRLWECPQIQTAKWRFTAWSIEFLLRVRNARIVSDLNFPKDWAQPPSGLPKATGDILLAWMLSSIFNKLGEEWDQHFAQIPLCVLSRPTLSGKVEFQSLFKDELAPLLPWLIQQCVEGWVSQQEWIWKRLDSEVFKTYWRTNSDVMREWIAACKKHKRPDLIAPLMNVFIALPKNAESYVGTLAANTRLRDRPKEFQSWLDALEVANSLFTLRDKLVAIHPIDRMGREKIFLDAFAAKEFSNQENHIHSLQNAIAPKLG